MAAKSQDLGGSPGGATQPQSPAEAGNPTEVAAAAGPYEEVLVRHSVGTGTFRTDSTGSYIVVTGKMYTLEGVPDGKYEAVFKAGFTDPSQLLKHPAPPEPPYDKPGPVAALNTYLIDLTKARWTFGDGASLEAPGPAISYLAPLKDTGSVQFWVSAAAFITGGTGRYEGAVGQETSLGSTWFGNAPDLKDGTRFEAKVFHIFKVIRKAFQGEAARPTPTPTQPAECLSHAHATSRYINVRGSKMHYLEAGSGDPIIFLHGNPVWSYVWRHLFDYLAPYGRCIAPDLIGFGMSDKPNIEYSFEEHYRYIGTFIKELKLKGKITLVIQDWGSGLGFHYAQRNPDRIKGIAFFEAMVRPYPSWDVFPAADASEDFRNLFRKFRSGGEGGEGWKLIVDENYFIETLLPGMMAPKTLTEAEWNCYRQPFKDPGSRKPIWRFPREIPIAGDPALVNKAVQDYSDWLTETELPLLLFYATPGAILTRDHVDWCEQNMNNLKVLHVGKGNHFLQESSPEFMGKHLAEWYRTISGIEEDAEET